jgi:hypothetical protein
MKPLDLIQKLAEDSTVEAFATASLGISYEFPKSRNKTPPPHINSI